MFIVIVLIQIYLYDHIFFAIGCLPVININILQYQNIYIYMYMYFFSLSYKINLRQKVKNPPKKMALFLAFRKK